MDQQRKFYKEIELGTCYYPEQWEESLWEDDLRRMKEVGIKTIRVAEFAWNKFEPEEGRYTFEFFDRFLDLAERMKIKVIFGTPTATPPAWLTEKYPEVLNCTIDGVPYKHGCRRHYNYNSPKYIEFTKIIVQQIASHYAKHPAIIGWQIDNEINCELNEFYSESDDVAFRSFLQEKYSTLVALNKAWGTVFWNQTYTDWLQVHLPQKVVHNSNNPHRVLDYIRFVSKSACNYVKIQSEILRQYVKPGDYITTNGLFSYLDSHQMTRESLDFFMYDSYPNFAYCLTEKPQTSDDLNDRKWSRHLSVVRSISPNFGIMEQQAGANGWNTRMEAPSPKPGQITLWAMQSIAHGADFVSFFRWRTSIMGTEIYWHGILDYSNRDNRRLAEVKQTYDKVKAIKDIAGAEYQASFAVFCDYNNVFDTETDVWHQRVEKASSKGIFNAAQLTHTPMDYVFFHKDMKVSDLEEYPVLFYPHAVILTNEITELLTEYVKGGGTLVLGCRTGYKDETGKCVMKKLPGLLQELSRVDVIDYTFLGPADETSMVDWDGTLLEAAVFNDILEPLEEAIVEGSFTNNYYSGQAGLISRKYGQGKVYYFGGAFSETTARVFLEKLKIADPFKEIISLPEGCELVIRVKDGDTYAFVLNYEHRKVSINVRKRMYDMFEGEMVSGSIELSAYETKVFKLQEEG